MTSAELGLRPRGTPGPSAHASTNEENSLWKIAYNELKCGKETAELVAEYEKTLGVVSEDSTGASPEKQISSVVQGKLATISSKQWKITWRTKRIAIRSQIERIVKAVQVLQNIGSAAASLDPVHAGLPWAGVCVLLTAITSDSEQNKALASGLEDITNLIAEYIDVEKVYLAEHEDWPHGEIRKHITLVYALVMKYQIMAVYYFDRSKLKRVAKNVLDPDDWNGMLQEAKSASESCKKFLERLDIQTLRTTLEEHQRDFTRLVESLGERDEQKEELLSWVSTVSVGDDHEFVRTLKLGEQNWNTGRWMFEHPEFKQWQLHTSGVFWLRGPVGTGKSCLASMVIQESLSGEDAPRTAYFYCTKDTSRPHRRDPVDILRSICAQLSFSSIEAVEAIYKKYQRDNKTLTRVDCKSLIGHLIDTAGPTTIIIDALDECTDGHDLVSDLSDILKDSRPLKLFFSSRLEDYVTPYFPARMVLEVTPERNERDVLGYIRRDIERRRVEIKKRRPNEQEAMTISMAAELEKILVERAGSMFRWVEMILDLFLNVHQKRHSRKTVQSELAKLRDSSVLPGLNSTYDIIYRHNTNDDPNLMVLASKALKMVLCSFRPLHIEELALVITIGETGEDGDDPLISPNTLLYEICSNFITTDLTGSVQLAHLSVREYLAQRTLEEVPEYSRELCHTFGAELCLEYFMGMSRGFDDPPSHFSQTLTAYAVLHWIYHCEEAGLGRRSGKLHVLLTDFLLSGEEFFMKWKIAMGNKIERLYGRTSTSLVQTISLRCFRQDQAVFYISCAFGFLEILEKLDLNALDLESTCDDYENVSGLALAAESGYIEIVQYLFDKGVVNGADSGLVLQIAALQGQ